MSERRTPFDLRRQARTGAPLVFVWAMGATILAIAALQDVVPVSSLFLDPNAVSDQKWYFGLVSNLGVLAWTVAATSAIGGSWVAYQTGRPSAGRFLGCGGAAASLMLLDDLFLLHSSAIPKLVGVPKVVAMALVVGPTVAWFVLFVSEIGRTRWLILVSAMSAFAFSVAADQAFHGNGTTALLLEDGAKLMGVLAWMAYFVMTTHDIARSTIRAAMYTDPVVEFMRHDAAELPQSLASVLGQESNSAH